MNWTEESLLHGCDGPPTLEIADDDNDNDVLLNGASRPITVACETALTHLGGGARHSSWPSGHFATQARQAGRRRIMAPTSETTDVIR